MSTAACIKLLLCLVAGLAVTLSCTPATRTGPADRVSLEPWVIREGRRLPRPCGGHAAGLVDGHLVVAGGTDWIRDRTIKEWLSDCWVYRSGSWISAPALPRRLAHASFASDGKCLILAGGTDGTQTSADTFRLCSLGLGSEWVKLAPLPLPLSGGAGAILNGRLFTACGEAGSTMSNEMWSLALEDDAGTAGWTSCAPLPGVPRAFPVLVRCGSFLYLLGGVSLWNPLTPLKDAYRYDAAADAWERLPDLPVAGYAWSAEAVDPHHVLLAGRADGEIHPEIWLLDIRNMAARTMGNAVIQTTTAALVRVNPQEWWLVGGEPDAKKTRTDRVTVIRMHPRRG